MVTRSAGALLLVPACVLAVVGAVHTSADALIGWVLVGVAAAVLVALGAPRSRPGGRGPGLLLGAATAALFVMACLAIAGLLTAFGGGFTAAVLILLVVAGLWAGNRHRRRQREKPVTRPDPHDVLAAVTLPVSSVPVAGLTTEELCASWRRSYFQVLLAPDASSRHQIAQRRQDLLDELERRDPRGFLRWLESGARPGGDPGPYLTRRSRTGPS